MFRSPPFFLSPFCLVLIKDAYFLPSSEYEGKKERERKETRVKYLWKRHIVIIFTLGGGSIVFLELRYVREGYVLVEYGKRLGLEGG